MSLIRIVLQVIVLYLVGILKIEAANEPKFSLDLQVETHNGAISVPSGFNLYTISITNKTIKINSTEAKVSSCSLNIDPFEESITSTTARAILIKRKNQIIVWGIHAEDKYNTYYSLLLIKQVPNTCIYEFAWQMPDDDKLEAYSYSTPLPLVYDHQDGFLVFFPSQRHCWPCRFNDFAEIMKQSKNLEIDSIPVMSSIHMQPFHSIDIGRDGWFYAANFPNRTSVVKLIDEKFNVTRKVYLNFTVQAIAANHKIVRNSGTCSTNANQIDCRRFNSKLLVVQSINISLDDTVSAISLEYDADGNWFVAAAAGPKIYVYIYNIDAQLIHSLDFGQVELDFKIREFRGYVTLEQRVDHYCLFVFQEKIIHARHSIRCISKAEYVPALK